MGQARKRGLLYSDFVLAEPMPLAFCGIYASARLPCEMSIGHENVRAPRGGYPISKDNRHRGRSVPLMNFKIGFRKIILVNFSGR